MVLTDFLLHTDVRLSEDTIDETSAVMDDDWNALVVCTPQLICSHRQRDSHCAGFIKIEHVPIIRLSMIVHTLHHQLNTAKTFKDIEGVLVQFVKDPRKPLIDIYQYCPQVFQTIVDYIWSDKPNSKLSNARFLLLMAGLNQASGNAHDHSALFFLLFSSYRKCLMSEEYKLYEDTLLTLIVNTILECEESMRARSFQVNYFLRHILPIDKYVDIALAMAISTCNTLSIKEKKSLFVTLMTPIQPKGEMILNWCHILQCPELTTDVHAAFYELVGAHIEQRCLQTPQTYRPFLNGFQALYEQFLCQSSEVETNLSVTTKMDAIAERLIACVQRSSDEQLIQFFKTFSSFTEKEKQTVLMVLFVKGKSLAELIEPLITVEKSAKKPPQEKTSRWHKDYWSTATKAIMRLDLNYPPDWLLEKLLAKDGVHQQVILLLMSLIIMFQKKNDSLVPKLVSWKQWIWSLIHTILVAHPETAIGKEMRQMIESLDIKSYLPKEDQGLLIHLMTQPKNKKEDIDSVVAEINQMNSELKARV